MLHRLDIVFESTVANDDIAGHLSPLYAGVTVAEAGVWGVVGSVVCRVVLRGLFVCGR